MPKLILLHGALASGRQFDPLLQRLRPELGAMSIDFSGHGETPANDRSYQLEQFCHEVLDAAGPEPVNLLGYSMGGYVAMHIALRYPERVKAIMTLSTKYRWTPETAASEKARLNPEMLESNAPDFVKAIQQQHPANDWKKLLAGTSAFLTKLGAHDYLRPELLSSVAHKACVAVGDRDKLVSLDETVATYKALPDAQLAVLPQTPHLLEKMDMEKVAWLANTFFVQVQ